MNHYYALLSEDGRPIVTLPAPHHGTKIAEDGTIGGLTGAMDIWNGAPPPWCSMIVEIRSPFPWYKILRDHKTVIWRRTE